METFGPHSGASAWGKETEKYDVENLSGKVKAGYVGEVGQDVTGTTLFYLMDNGTVEYTKMFVIKTNPDGTTYYNMNYTYEKDSNGKITGQHFESQGKVNGVEDAYELYTVDAVPDDGSDGPKIGGYVTTIASKKDGSFYDLGNVIDK